MRLDRIRVRHWRGIRQADVDLRATPRAVVMGANGTGKSSLFILAPLFGLFGHCDTNQGDQIMRGADAADVEIFFAHRGSTYRVRRTVSRKSGTTLQLDRTSVGDGSVEVLADGRVREVQAAIDELLGFSAAALRCGPLMQQGESARFTNATAAERLDYVAEILGAEHWREAYTEARARRRELDKDLERALEAQRARATKLEAIRADDMVLEQKRTALAELPLADELTGLEAQLGEELEAAQAKWHALAEKADALEALRRELDQARKAHSASAQRVTLAEAKHRTELEQLRIRQEELGDPPRPLDEIVAEGKAARASHAAKAQQRDHGTKWTTEAEACRKQVGALNGRPAECDMDHCGLIRGALDARKRLDELNRKLDGFSVPTQNDVDEAAKRVQELLEEHKRASAYPEKQRLLEGVRSAVARMQTEIEKHRAEAKADQAECDKLEKRIADQADDRLADVAAEVKAAQGKLDEARKRSELMARTRQRLDLEIQAGEKRIAEKRAELADEVELDELNRKLEVAEAAQDFCKVAPQIVVEASVGTIEAVANDVLADLFPGARLRLEQTRHGATTSRDELTVQVLADGVEAPLATFSGGERFRLDLALRLGLSSAAGGEVDSLVLDEGWGSQDPAAVSALKDAIRGLAERFDRIIVITHREEVADLFGTVLTVRTSEAGTTIDQG